MTDDANASAPVERPIRWGVLATGGIAHSVTTDLCAMPDAEVLAVGSRTQARADAFAAGYGIARPYGSYAELIADEELDVIYVASPHGQHHRDVKPALEAGRAVLCEKALTAKLDDAEDLVATARAGGVFFMEAMKTRFNPLVVRVRELIAEGAIGEICAVSASFGNPVPYDPAHRLWAPELGGGALLDLGVYVVSFAQMLLGAPDQTYAAGALAPNGVDAEAGLLLRWESGAHALLDCSLRAEMPRTAIISGTAGQIELTDSFHNPTQMVLHRRGFDTETTHRPLEGNGFREELREVHRCLRVGATESPTMPLDDTLAVMRVLVDGLGQLGARTG